MTFFVSGEVDQHTDCTRDEDDTAMCPIHSNGNTSDNNATSGNIIGKKLTDLKISEKLQVQCIISYIKKMYIC